MITVVGMGNKSEDLTQLGAQTIKNEENTNGIAYFSVCFPVDVLAPEDYQYLPLFSYCATNVVSS